MKSSEPSPPRIRGGLAVALMVVGVVVHLLIGVFPYAVSGLVAPPWGVAVLLAWWAALLGAQIVVIRERRPLLALAIPAVAFVSWVVLVTLGDLFLGWTA